MALRSRPITPRILPSGRCVMLDAPSIACRVLRSFADPIVAHRGEVLTVWPGHPELTLTILDRDGKPLRWQHYPELLVYGMMLHLYLDAKIEPLSLASERALLRVA